MIQSYPYDIDMSFYPKTSSSISQGQLAAMNHANEISLSGSFCFRLVLLVKWLKMNSKLKGFYSRTDSFFRPNLQNLKRHFRCSFYCFLGALSRVKNQ